MRLVSSEIGAKDKQPHGRIGAIIGLAAVFLYIGVRATFHSNAVATLQARTYRSELPRHVAAFPEIASILTWHGVVETESAFQQATVTATPGAWFNPESGLTLFKPDSSPILDKARDTHAAQAFLSVARFPKASIERTDTGYVVDLRDLRYAALRETRREVAALIHIDSDGSVVEQRLVWGRDLQRK
jgi:hypothetical protein